MSRALRYETFDEEVALGAKKKKKSKVKAKPAPPLLHPPSPIVLRVPLAGLVVNGVRVPVELDDEANGGRAGDLPAPAIVGGRSAGVIERVASVAVPPGVVVMPARVRTSVPGLGPSVAETPDSSEPPAKRQKVESAADVDENAAPATPSSHFRPYQDHLLSPMAMPTPVSAKPAMRNPIKPSVMDMAGPGAVASAGKSSMDGNKFSSVGNQAGVLSVPPLRVALATAMDGQLGETVQRREGGFQDKIEAAATTGVPGPPPHALQHEVLAVGKAPAPSQASSMGRAAERGVSGSLAPIWGAPAVRSSAMQATAQQSAQQSAQQTALREAARQAHVQQQAALARQHAIQQQQLARASAAAHARPSLADDHRRDGSAPGRVQPSVPAPAPGGELSSDSDSESESDRDSADPSAAQRRQREIQAALHVFQRNAKVPCPATYNDMEVTIVGCEVRDSALHFALNIGISVDAFKIFPVGNSKAAKFNRKLCLDYRSWLMFVVNG